MRIIEPSVLIERGFTTEDLRLIEAAARTCYKSEDRTTEESYGSMTERLIHAGHHAMIEHAVATVRFVVDRGVSHELMRHRLASFAQESTRYCNYSQGKFGGALTFIKPWFFVDVERPASLWSDWVEAMQCAEDSYLALLKAGASAQEARSVLPISTKTEVVMTANAREWRHVLGLRAMLAAHPQMRQVMVPLARAFARQAPCLFGDIGDRLSTIAHPWEAEVTLAQKGLSGEPGQPDLAEPRAVEPPRAG